MQRINLEKQIFGEIECEIFDSGSVQKEQPIQWLNSPFYNKQ